MENKSCAKLPNKYVLDYELDIIKDKKLLIKLNIYSFVLFALVMSIYLLIIKFTDKSLSLQELGNASLKMLIFILLSILYIFAHEIVHAIVYKFYTKEKVKFGFHGMAASASVPGVYFYKKPYLTIGLAPFIVFTILFIVPIFFLNGVDLLLLFLLIGTHIGGCIGDFFVSFKLLKYPDNTLIEDMGPSMRFYVETEKTSSDILWDLEND